MGKKQGTPRKGYIPCGDAKAREGEGSERERRGGEERRVWRAEREEEWGFGNWRPGGAGAEGGRPLLADQPRRGRGGGGDVVSCLCKWQLARASAVIMEALALKRLVGLALARWWSNSGFGRNGRCCVLAAGCGLWTCTCQAVCSRRSGPTGLCFGVKWG